ncbi:MAG TPA: SpoIIE family protein phosphatase [Nocardioides sp.]|nr:SpoIIE family protein phosphatase [Nocardioides sp.]
MQRYIDELRLLHALRLAVLATDRDGTVTFANEAAGETCACSVESLVGKDIRELAADPQAAVPLDLAAVLAGQTWSGDLTVRRPRGDSFVAAVSATPVRDREGTVTGALVVAQDMTEVRAAETDAAASETRLRLAHDAARLGSWHWDMAAGVTVWDEALEVMYGLPPGGFGGTFEAWLGTVHPDDQERVLAVVQEALEARSSYVLQNRTVRPDGALQWIEAHGKVTVDEQGNPTGTIGCVRDITEEKLQREREREAAARARLLQEVTAELSGALTHEEVTQVLARGLKAAASIIGERVQLRLPDDLATLTGEALVATPAVELEPEDQQLLDTLASQGAITAERARLHERTREIAEQLQSSLAASPLPDLAAFELAAFYSPGGDELEHVGGDWYDAVATRDGSLALVVGDVMGRGVRAATTMIRVRAGIRGLVTVDPTPRAVLAAADAMLIRDAPDQFVTAAAVLVDPASRTLTLGNAGHVPLAVVHPDGRAELVGAGTGVPLGVVRGQERSHVTVALEPGALLVLVTDGVVESRREDLDHGLARLVERATALRTAPLPELVAALAELADPTLSDDVTVVAARLS